MMPNQLRPQRQIIENFCFILKSNRNSLKWILLEGIGKPVIIENKDISTQILNSRSNLF